MREGKVERGKGRKRTAWKGRLSITRTKNRKKKERKKIEKIKEGSKKNMAR